MMKPKACFQGSEEPGEDAGLLEGAVLLERRKEMHCIVIARVVPN
jgi:hypothetical protein